MNLFSGIQAKAVLMSVTKSRLFRYLPMLIGCMLILGNANPSLPIWGFNYHVLGLRPGYGWYGSLFIFLLSVYPAFTVGERSYHQVYAGIAICSLSLFTLDLVMALRSVFMWGFPIEKTVSIFSSFPVLCGAYIALIAYLIFVLTWKIFTKKDVLLILFSVAVTALISCWSFLIRLGPSG